MPVTLSNTRSSKKPLHRPGRGVITIRESSRRKEPTRPSIAIKDDLIESVTPRATDGADWETGITKNYARLRPYLNGQPAPGALAASISQGWIDIVRPRDQGDARWENFDLPDEAMGLGRQRLHGVVTIMPDRY